MSGSGNDGLMRLAVRLSRISANRAEFFDLIEGLEGDLGRPVDAITLEGLLDAEFAGRTQIAPQEALTILSNASPLRAIRQG